MNVEVHESEEALAAAAARHVALIASGAIGERGEACLVAATGASQLLFLGALAREAGVDWSRVTFFHLDEYLGLPADHPASFRKYLRERVADRLRPGAFHYVDGEALGEAISRRVVDAALVGIGENGHIAFNDPPADFDTREPYLVVELDEACRSQQVGEGWFPSLEDVPRRAISMSVWQILQARHVVSVVPERRKARAVRDCLEMEVSPWRPASVLRRHPRAVVFLETASASLLREHPERNSRIIDA
jgi:glucosamine-6-phosphate deaminase